MIMAMVKAFSYGTGSHEIAGFLEYHGVHYLGVAYADEGVELRRKGIRMPVMVMAPEASSMDSIITHHLEPEIYNFESLSWISAFSEDIVKIHLKFDTGMHRLGFARDEIHLLCDALKQMPHVRVMSLFSHLATADDTSDSDFTLKQLNVFNEMCSQFSSLCGYMPLRHILNSAGTENYTDAQFDMVRPGLGLYGIPSDENNRLNLQQSIRLKTQIIQIKNIAKGDRIGYGTSCIAQSDMTIAVVPIGYADGFRRSLSNGKGIVHVSGKPCRVVGNVCMDMSMIDVTNVRCQPGDEVIIFDEQYTVSEFAQAMGVIPYEAITGISQRVKRRYLTE
jgi:alanine racemase